LSLSTTWRDVGAEASSLHSFLTSALERIT
jgi:hypothetical protein